jgi:hypothetical protein
LIELLCHIILCSLAIIGLYNAASPGNLLDFVGDWAVTMPGLYNPIIGCPTCMASVWGSVYFIALQPAGWLYFPAFILATSATATFLNRLLPADDPTP